MTAIQYRAARNEDVPEMADVFLASIGDLYARHNVQGTTPPGPMVQAGYRHLLSTGIFHVAVLDGRIISIAGAVVRDHIWYLSSFWTRPGIQRQGASMPLLKIVRDAGKEANATTFCVHSSVDLPAMAAYMKLGMLPGHAVFYFKGTPQALPEMPPGYTAAPLDRGVAMELDREVRGTSRQPEHELWQRMGMKGTQISTNGKVVGYYYLGAGGIGPAAWSDSMHARAVMTQASSEAVAIGQEVTFSAPGVNHDALRFALAHGLRLTNGCHFFTTAPFGHMDRYLPSGPAFY